MKRDASLSNSRFPKECREFISIRYEIKLNLYPEFNRVLQQTGRLNYIFGRRSLPPGVERIYVKCINFSRATVPGFNKNGLNTFLVKTTFRTYHVSAVCVPRTTQR